MRLDRLSLIAIASFALAAGCGKHTSLTDLPGTATLGQAIATTSSSEAAAVESAAPPAAPRARFVYVADACANTVAELALDGETGAYRTVGQPVDVGGSAPWALAVDPSSRFLYVANRGTNDISGFAIDPVTGALGAIAAGAPRATTQAPSEPRVVDRKVATTPFFQITTLLLDVTPETVMGPATRTAPTGNSPVALAVSPDGTRLVVANFCDATLGSYTIDAKTGMLTPASVLSLGATTAPVAVAFDPSGESLYVCGGPSGYICAVAIDPVGKLAGLDGMVRAGDCPVGLAVNSDGSMVVVATYPENALRVFVHDDFGQLVPKGDPIPVGADPSAVALDAKGSVAVVAAHDSGQLLAFSIDADQVVKPAGAVTGGPWLDGVSLDASGQLAFAASPTDETLVTTRLDAATHAPGPVAAVKLGVAPALKGGRAIALAVK